jgi:DNA-binding transcriptional ArsR family regulator
MPRTSCPAAWPIRPAAQSSSDSKHLSVLKRAGSVRDRRAGRQTHYSAQPQGLAPLIDWMSLHGAFWRDRFDTLESLLDRMEGARDGWQRFVARLERVTARLG